MISNFFVRIPGFFHTMIHHVGYSKMYLEKKNVFFFSFASFLCTTCGTPNHINKRRFSRTYFSLSHPSYANTSGTPNHFNKRGVYHTFFSLSLFSHTPHMEPPTTLIKKGSIRHTFFSLSLLSHTPMYVSEYVYIYIYYYIYILEKT